jgi:hypothetical protein
MKVLTAQLPKTIPTRPRNVVPGDRHDNDKENITQIAIIPTESEIRSEHSEFLPSFAGPHFLHGANRLLDTHFRLYRYDIFGEVKYVIKGLLDHPLGDIEENGGIQNNTTSFAYFGAGVTNIRPSKHGIEAQIKFQTPFGLQGKTMSQRRQWWNATKKLEEGTLLCLILLQDGKRTPLFFVVTSKSTDHRDKFSLVSKDGPIISGKLTSIKSSQLRSLIVSFGRTDGFLVEFPNIVPATFMPVLENLQRMQRDSQLPFANWILEQGINNLRPTIPPPTYTRHPGFSFDLSPISVDPSTPLAFKPGGNMADISEKLEKMTTLDEGQCKALVAALSREFALIQGPPGTGKSYVGIQLVRVLLANKEKASLGPIIIVCYTNHALDQFLEHLLAAGIKDIIRIGSNGSSKLLEEKNLRAISKYQYKARSEARALGQAFALKQFNEDMLSRYFERLHHIQDHSWRSIRDHIYYHYREIYHQFLHPDGDGFNKASEVVFDLWITGTEDDITKLNPPCVPSTPITILSAAVKNVYSLAQEDREVLVNYWASEIMEDATGNIWNLIQDVNKTQTDIDVLHSELSRRLLAAADVIGVTTTGLAKNASVLRSINTKVIICEEAAEVLEAHMLSTLIPSIQHLIQIGDHEQLRPQIRNFDIFSSESSLGKQYQLDRSLFERLAVQHRGKPSFPITQLHIQRRMRPEISRLIRDTLYHRLLDHPDTHRLPNVVGMRKNVFWYHHTNAEDRCQHDSKGKSHSNNAEVDMIYALVQHITRQDVYKDDEIAILTPYASQLRKLQLKLSKSFKVVLGKRDQGELSRTKFDTTRRRIENLESHVMKQAALERSVTPLLRIATVDSFQGEEAKIVVISLVRSNKSRSVGFLKTTNRINVLLTRAQHGMYIIGNADTYAHIPMWNKVLDILQQTDSVGEASSLFCAGCDQ